MSPFRVPGPALISFSGGRTSAYMLHEILRAYDGKLPNDVTVAFANTGKEREETLRFVHECGSRWGVEIAWLEWRRGHSFVVVDFATAARAGEPFADLIDWKGMPPNWQARFCTTFLKIVPLQAYAASLDFTDYQEVIGLRADEGHRLLKMLARNDADGRKCVAPLSRAGVTVRDVAAFWRAQPFDLGLSPGEGNCDLCHLKGRGLRKALIRQRPDSATWWIKQEAKTGGFFDRRDLYAELAAEVAQQPSFVFDFADEHDAECGLLCGTDEPEAVAA